MDRSGGNEQTAGRIGRGANGSGTTPWQQRKNRFKPGFPTVPDMLRYDVEKHDGSNVGNNDGPP